MGIKTIIIQWLNNSRRLLRDTHIKLLFLLVLLFAFAHMCECVTCSKLLLRHLSLSAVVNITLGS